MTEKLNNIFQALKISIEVYFLRFDIFKKAVISDANVINYWNELSFRKESQKY